MSIRTYYRWTLALPFAVPALLSPLMLAGESLPDILRGLLLLLVYSLLLGGIPYAIFAAGFLVWMRRKTDAEVRTGILFAPIVYSLVLFVCVALFLARGDLGNAFDALGPLTAFAYLFGYAYVALAEAGRILLRPSASEGGELIPA